MLKDVVFLDRDGVINRDSPDYIKGLAEFACLPGSLAALGRLARCGFTLIIATNQSALGRGLLSAAGLDEIHAALSRDAARHGAAIREFLVCPHRPEEGCPCRKPRPGLIAEAVRRLGIDLASAVMVGDSAKDIRCGRAAGVGTTVLVRTGNGRAAERELAAAGEAADLVVADLAAAARALCARRRGD
jgi:D-glycero-D-manno-heptose 1,7-bisphosphate phosphatase